MIGRLALAALLGSVIGLERERLLWAAGLRTHMLVCVGSCLIMLVSAFGFADALGTKNVVLDPSRIAAQVVSGIGFLGAGTILLRGEVVKGLTTAASLWAVAAIGLAIGSGLYVPAVATTAWWSHPGGDQAVRGTLARADAVADPAHRPQGRDVSIDTLHAVTGERASRVRQFTHPPASDPDLDEVTYLRPAVAHELRERSPRSCARPRESRCIGRRLPADSSTVSGRLAVEEQPVGRVVGLVEAGEPERLDRRIEPCALGRRHRDAGEHPAIIGAVVAVVEQGDVEAVRPARPGTSSARPAAPGTGSGRAAHARARRPGRRPCSGHGPWPSRCRSCRARGSRPRAGRRSAPASRASARRG